MTFRTAAVFTAALIVGALAAYMLGLGATRNAFKHEPDDGSTALLRERGSEPTLSGGGEGRGAAEAVPAGATETTSHAHAAVSARPPSVFPSAVLDAYEQTSPRAYRDIVGPVRLYSPLDDLQDVVRGRDVWTTGKPVESVARAAAQRRGEDRLPGQQFALVGIPLGSGLHEVFVGTPANVDAGSGHQLLVGLLKLAGVGRPRVDAMHANYQECLRLADEYMRARIRYRLVEAKLIARRMSEAAWVADDLANSAFILPTSGGSLAVVDAGTSVELDRLLREYRDAPATGRSRVDEVVGD